MNGLIRVGKRGNRLTFNGNVQDFVTMRTAFKWLFYFIRWARGEGEDEIDKARRFAERCKKHGFQVLRVFSEGDDWLDAPFWKEYPTPDRPIWNPRAKPGSTFPFPDVYRKVIPRAIEVLQEFELVMQLVIVVTQKHNPLIPNTVNAEGKSNRVGYWGHMLRVWAEYLNEIDSRNLLAQAFNEVDAHTNPMVPRSELRKMANRWRHRDWPGALLSISQGGGWDVKYPVGGSNGFSPVDVHTPRGLDEWFEISDEVGELVELHPDQPIILDENMFNMTPEQWDFYVTQKGWSPDPKKIAKLAAQSRAGDGSNFQRQWNQAIEGGAAGYCVHDLTGGGTDPDQPISRVEERHREQFGDGVIEPPPPPPPKVLRHDHVIDELYRIYLQRELQKDGHYADPVGLMAYNEFLNERLEEGDMNAVGRMTYSLMSSTEYKDNFTR